MRGLTGRSSAVGGIGNDAAIAHLHCARAPGRDLGIVGDDHQGRASGPGGLGEHLQHLVPGVLVECTRGLIGEHHTGGADQGAGDRHPLRLTAGELPGSPGLHPAQAEVGQPASGDVGGLGPGGAGEHQRQGCVLVGGSSGRS